MSGVYDNWSRLVEAVLKREELRHLARCESLSSYTSDDFSLHLSLDSSHEDAAVGNRSTGAIAEGITTGFGNSSTGANAKGITTAVGNSATRATAGWGLARAARLIAAPAVAFARYRRGKRRDYLVDVPAVRVHPNVRMGQFKRFSLRELQVATDNFSNKNFLGIGRFGQVYKGRLPDGSLVAVKRIKESKELPLVFGTVVHRNLFHLRGFCMALTERLLVFPLMVNGCVASWLRERPESRPPLDWPLRKRIALGSARGLAYLHDHCNPTKIIHRDVKAANILLDKDFEAVISGFCFAIFMDCNDTHVTTAVRGTMGYIAPEYLSTGECSEKTDVFSYGVMLLELITGQKAFSLARLANDDDFMLLDWVKGLLKETKLGTLVDEDLQGNYIDEEVEQLIQVALLCTQSSPMERPKMSEVIRMIEGDGLAERRGGMAEGRNVPTRLQPHTALNTDWIGDDERKSVYFVSP